MTSKHTKGLRVLTALGVSVAVAAGGSATISAGDRAPASADTTTPEDTAPAGTAAEGTAAEGTTAGTAAGGEASGHATTTATGDDCPESEQGLTDTEINLGGSYPLSGPVAAYAAVPTGVKAWFDYLNDTEGGITAGDGVTRQVNWNFLDDQYQPPSTLENVRRLLEQDGSWLILNPLGSPSNAAIRDYMNESEVPQLYVATGASAWGDVENYPWTIGYQPDYESEGIAYTQFVLNENPDATIAVLHANDDFGRDYLTGIEEGMAGKEDQLVSVVTYETTDATIDSQVAQALSSNPDAFLLIATPQFAIQGINQTQALGYEGTRILTSVSSSVGAVIANTNDGAADGWYTDTYLKDPTDPQYDEDPAMIQYKEILAEYAPDANPDDGLILYGMSVGQLFQQTLEALPTICRASVMEAAKNLTWAEPPLLIDGIGIQTGPGDGFPVQQVQMMQWDGEEYVYVGELIDAASAAAED